MPKKRHVLVRGSPRWEVDFGVDALGKKRRRFFKTEAAAEAAIDAHEKSLKRGEEYLARMTKGIEVKGQDCRYRSAP